MSSEDYNLFESVIHITEERDKKSLEKALIATLSGFIDFDALILLRIPRTADSEYLEVAGAIPKTAAEDKFTQIPHDYGEQRVAYDEDVKSCVDSGAFVSQNAAGTQRTLWPVIVNNIVIGILDIYGHHHTENTQKLIRGFIRIYSNFLAIIDDNEHDTLTGLLNRKTFDVQLSNLLLNPLPDTDNSSATGEERREEKNNAFYWVGILDIDHFKEINDNFGHIYGDEVLLLFANLMEKKFRNSDLLFRYGGEEFVVVLSPTTESDAFTVFDRFRQELELFEFPQVGQVTVSAGMIKIDTQEHPSIVLERADQALYYAKEHGRNQICSYYELINAGLLTARHIESDIELF